jgi:hypothetical protein
MTPIKRDLFRDVLNKYELFNLPKPCPYNAFKIVTSVPDETDKTKRLYEITDMNGVTTKTLTKMFTRVDPKTNTRHSIVLILEKEGVGK